MLLTYIIPGMGTGDRKIAGPCWVGSPTNCLGNSRLVRDNLKKEVDGIWELTLEAVLSLTMLCLHTDIHIHTSKLFQINVNKCFAFVFVYHICTCCCLRPEESRFPQNWSYRRLWAPMIFWELNGGPLEEQHVLLTAKPPFQPAWIYFQIEASWSCIHKISQRFGLIDSTVHGTGVTASYCWLVSFAWKNPDCWLVFRSLDLFLVTLPLALLYQKYLSLLCSKVN